MTSSTGNANRHAGQTSQLWFALRMKPFWNQMTNSNENKSPLEEHLDKWWTSIVRLPRTLGSSRYRWLFFIVLVLIPTGAWLSDKYLGEVFKSIVKDRRLVSLPETGAAITDSSVKPATIRPAASVSIPAAERPDETVRRQIDCEGGDLNSCFALSLIYEGRDKSDSHRDAYKAFKFASKACAGDVDAACFQLAGYYSTGFGVLADPLRAFALLTRTCHRKMAAACYNAGQTLRRRGDMAPEAFAFMKAGCDGGFPAACGALGSMTERGESVSVDYSKARELYTMACHNRDAESCTSLAGLYKRGFGVEQDSDRALSLYKQACDGGDGRGCFLLAAPLVFGSDQLPMDKTRARELIHKSCALNDPNGCYVLAFDYNNGDGVPKDKDRALALWVAACEKELPKGCVRAGEMYLTGDAIQADTIKSLAFFKKACNEREGSGCEALAHLYQAGTKVTANPEVAQNYLRLACQLGAQSACDSGGRQPAIKNNSQ